MYFGSIASSPLGGSGTAWITAAYGLYKAVTRRHSDQPFITLLTISHSSLTTPIRVCDDAVVTLSTGVPGVISGGYEFVQLPFEVQLPNQEADTPPRARIAIDNVSKEVTTAIAEITSPPSITLQIALAADPNVIELDLPGFQIEQVSFDALVIEGDLIIEQLEAEPYPAGRFLPSGFPGLFRANVTVETV